MGKPKGFDLFPGETSNLIADELTILAANVAPSVTEEWLRNDVEVRTAFRSMLIAKYNREVQILEERRGIVA